MINKFLYKIAKLWAITFLVAFASPSYATANLCLIEHFQGFSSNLELPAAIDELKTALTRLNSETARLKKVDARSQSKLGRGVFPLKFVDWLKKDDPSIKNLNPVEVAVHYYNRAEALSFLVDQRLRVLVAKEAAPRIWEDPVFQSGLKDLQALLHPDQVDDTYTQDQLFNQMVRGMQDSTYKGSLLDWHKEGATLALVLAEAALKKRLYETRLERALAPKEAAIRDLRAKQESWYGKTLEQQGVTREEHMARYLEAEAQLKALSNEKSEIERFEQKKYWDSIAEINKPYPKLSWSESTDTREERKQKGCCADGCDHCPLNFVSSRKVVRAGYMPPTIETSESSVTEAKPPSVLTPPPRGLALPEVLNRLETAFPETNWRVHDQGYTRLVRAFSNRLHGKR